MKALVQRAGLDEDFEFPGPAEGGALHQEYRNADLFILPSHTENFGMVVGEAMSHGLPVITTHGAPWQGLEEHDCGWWTPVSAAGIADALQAACHTDANTLQAMGARGRDWMRRDFGWDGIAARMMETYGEVAGKWKK